MIPAMENMPHVGIRIIIAINSNCGYIGSSNIYDIYIFLLYYEGYKGLLPDKREGYIVCLFFLHSVVFFGSGRKRKMVRF